MALRLRRSLEVWCGEANALRAFVSPHHTSAMLWSHANN